MVARCCSAEKHHNEACVYLPERKGRRKLMQTGERSYKTLSNCLPLVVACFRGKKSTFIPILNESRLNSACTRLALLYSFSDYYFPAVYCCADSLNVFAFITKSNWHIDFLGHAGRWYFSQSDCTFPFEAFGGVFFFFF